MMNSELIDQDDFRDRLLALGFDIPRGASAEEACAAVLATSDLSEEHTQALRDLAEGLLGGSAILLPALREALRQQLLPALAQRGA